MHKIHKHITLVLVVVGLVVSNLGAMKGAADYHYIAAEDPINIMDSSVTVENSVAKRANMRHNVYITAYSSRVKEPDSTPFTTASGTRVRDGIVAANWLPIGAKVKIPTLFGDKIFVVEDRMARKNNTKLDIWFASTKDAIHFGVKRARVEIL